MDSQRKKAYLALLTTSCIWGLAPPIIKYTLGFISPLTYLFYRFLIVSLILIIPLIWKIIKSKPSRKEILLYLGLGFIGTPLTLLLFFFGLQRTTAVNASIISLFTPVLIILGGVIFLKEKIELNEKMGIIFIFAGAFLGILEPLLISGLAKDLTGNLLVLAGAFTWASFSLLRRKFGSNLDSFILTASSFLVGLIFLFFISSFCDLRLAINDSRAFPGIFYMAILGSIIAYFTYIYGFAKIEASEATLFTYLEPVFAIPASIIFLKEKISPVFGLGALLIVAGIFLAEFFPALELKPVDKL